MSNVLNGTSPSSPAHPQSGTTMPFEDLGFCHVGLFLPDLSSLKDNQEKEALKL